MTVRQFLKSIGSGVTALSVMACAGADEPLVTNVGRFEIPFDVDAAPGESVEGYAVLFGSQDGGTTWEKLQTVPASQSGFQFSAPRDGRYSFAVRRMDGQGNLQEAITNATPELEIVVDTTAPELRLELFEAAQGQAMLKWQSADSNLNTQTLKLEFSEGNDGRWRPVRAMPNASGQVQLQTTPGSVVSVRASISDFAGNVVQKTGQLVLNSNSAIQNTASAPGALAIPATPSGNGASFAGAGPAQPFGPSPFQSGNSASSFSGLAIPGTTSTPSAPVIRSSPSVQPDPVAPVVPGAPVTQLDAEPSGSNSFSFPAQATSSSGDVNPFASHETQMQDGAQLVNNRVFDIDYTVEDVGPSGVGAVDLFVTEDGGQQWFRYGSDDDLKSPFQVDSMGEGTFGFAVRVRNGLGISDPPPQPGDLPMIVVTVDQTPPVIEFPAPVLRPDGTGSVQLSWRISEANSASHSVRLEFAGAPNGPWTPLFDWQKDTGNYTWTLRQGGPTSVYFRLMARDAAGNVASAQNAQPVVVDLKRPVARVLRVQAASSTAPARGF